MQATESKPLLSRIRGQLRFLTPSLKAYLPWSLSGQTRCMRELERRLEVEPDWMPWPPSFMGRCWGAHPDFLLFLCETVLKRRSQHVLECGCGLSSLVIARSLELAGSGHLTSLEHHADFAGITRECLESRGLADRVTIHHAPLSAQEFQEQSYLWYDVSNVELTELQGQVSCLVVDGPPADLGPAPRYPAGPVLFPLLADDAVVLLDDARRSGERRAFRRWKRERPGWKSEFRKTAKGCSLLRPGTSAP